jgi:hypothetical protein
MAETFSLEKKRRKTVVPKRMRRGRKIVRGERRWTN